MRNILTFFSMTIGILSCNQNSPNKMTVPKECILLNDKGVKYLLKNTADNKELDTAISFFKRAIACDNNYFAGNINLANACTRIGDFNSAIQAYNKLLLLTNNYPGFAVKKGILFEKMNKLDSARHTYLLAKKLYNNKLAVDPSNIDAIKGHIYLKALTIGKDSAIYELKRQ